jgi:glutamate-1-semialdehyde 2,1-aminomutase
MATLSPMTNTTTHATTQGQAVRARLAAKMHRSQELTSVTCELMNMGSAASLEMPHPVLMESAKGAYLTDSDGNDYIDFQIGFGALVLGHQHPDVQAALLEQIDGKGWHFGLHNPGQIPLAEQIIKADNCAERVIFCNTGTEATMYAIRAMRAFTSKPKIAVFDGSYHGAHDYGIGIADPDSPSNAPVWRALGAGVPDGIAAHQMMLPYRSEAAFELIRANKDELAAVIIEPAQSSNPQMSDEIEAYLKELKQVCAECDVLLMFDEVITGFRFAYGGAQEFYGVKPDIVTYGKILGGGCPIGAVGGREDILRLFSALGTDPKSIMSGGTFSGNPLSMAAGFAQLNFLDENRQDVYPTINALGRRLTKGINDFATENEMDVLALNAGSMFQIYFTDGPINTARDIPRVKSAADTEFYLHLLDKGVLVPGTRRSFVSYAHTAEIIDEAVGHICESLDSVREDGLI